LSQLPADAGYGRYASWDFESYAWSLGGAVGGHLVALSAGNWWSLGGANL
jgi:hypothetical protein